MSTFIRLAVTFQATVAVAIGAFFYNTVFIENLLQYAPESGPFAAPVGHLQVVVPIVLVTILAAVWSWLIYGAVQEERRVEQRRMPR